MFYSKKLVENVFRNKTFWVYAHVALNDSRDNSRDNMYIYLNKIFSLFILYIFIY